jgi:FlaA1/EpsC-like NDP-sugar epimerase
MGASKRLAEQIVLSKTPYGASYCTVRFGNVLGSRGSVIPTFARQIADGGPVTVTDARMTRFFMSVEEAVQLVLESSVLSDGGGEIFMLEMGDPVRIVELAERMIRLSGFQVGVDIPIEIVGIRPGEKLDEVLRAPEEEVLATYHPYINQLIPTSTAANELETGLVELRAAASRRDVDTVRELLFSICSSSVSNTDAKVDSSADAATESDGSTDLSDPSRGHTAGSDARRSKGTSASSSEQVPA